MWFYALLLAVNFACFVPLLALNVGAARSTPAVANKAHWTWMIRLLYVRWRSRDPLRVNIDFTA